VVHHVVSYLLRLIQAAALVSCSMDEDVGVDNTLPGIQSLSSPTLAARVTRVRVHQPEHLADRSLPVSHHGFHQELSNVISAKARQRLPEVRHAKLGRLIATSRPRRVSRAR